MNAEKLPIYFSPLQGYTDAIYRNAHARIFGGVDSYYSPFVRIEHGDFRKKDLRDIDPASNSRLHLIPQLIASSIDKMDVILNLFVEKGYQEVNINLGCPFPLLAKRHNGAGMLPYPEEVKDMLMHVVDRYPQLDFSVKLRLGWENAQECMDLIDLFNELPLTHLILHPRLGRQQYKGEVDLQGFRSFYEACSKPLIYNGDIHTVEDIEKIQEQFPHLKGVMIGRGLLAHPALAFEYKENKTLDAKTQNQLIRELHTEVYASYENLLEGGEQQLLMKMKSFWEYLLPEGDRKAKKIIHKTSKITNYLAAVSNLLA